MCTFSGKDVWESFKICTRKKVVDDLLSCPLCFAWMARDTVWEEVLSPLVSLLQIWEIGGGGRRGGGRLVDFRTYYSSLLCSLALIITQQGGSGKTVVRKPFSSLKNPALFCIFSHCKIEMDFVSCFLLHNFCVQLKCKHKQTISFSFSPFSFGLHFTLLLKAHFFFLLSLLMIRLYLWGFRCTHTCSVALSFLY